MVLGWLVKKEFPVDRHDMTVMTQLLDNQLPGRGKTPLQKLNIGKMTLLFFFFEFSQFLEVRGFWNLK
jgi:hypothetical protein